MAKVVEDDELLRILSTGDVAANEVFYHKPAVKCCLQTFKYEYERRINQEKINTVEEHEMKWKKLCALNKIFYQIMK